MAAGAGTPAVGTELPHSAAAGGGLPHSTAAGAFEVVEDSAAAAAAVAVAGAARISC